MKERVVERPIFSQNRPVAAYDLRRARFQAHGRMKKGKVVNSKKH
jgi:hypothetical protein